MVNSNGLYALPNAFPYTSYLWLVLQVACLFSIVILAARLRFSKKNSSFRQRRVIVRTIERFGILAVLLGLARTMHLVGFTLSRGADLADGAESGTLLVLAFFDIAKSLRLLFFGIVVALLAYGCAILGDRAES